MREPRTRGLITLGTALRLGSTGQNRRTQSSSPEPIASRFGNSPIPMATSAPVTLGTGRCITVISEAIHSGRCASMLHGLAGSS
jgi:hypothetical protein